MRVYAIEQRSEAWFALRCGRVTGSCAEAIIKERQRGSGELKERADLRHRLITERLTGIAGDDIPYKGKDLEHGISCEPEAFSAYEAATGEIALRIGFVAHDELMAGCSPDGYIGDPYDPLLPVAWDGIVEFKCPASTTHLGYLQADVIPKEYRPQLLHALWITGAAWADFCSYDPRFQDPKQRIFRKRLLAKDVATELAAYELSVRLFLSSVDEAVKALSETAVA